MAEFFLSTDFGMLLGVFIFGVSISGRLAAWGRAFVSRITAMARRSVRYRMHVAESEIQKLDNRDDAIFSKLHEMEKMIKFSDCGDLEDRIKVIEDWLTDKASTEETEDIIKKKAKERAAAIKKLN